jgi:predicted phosphodiesterase
MIHDVVRLTCKRPQHISRVCEKLGISTKELTQIVDQARPQYPNVILKRGWIYTAVKPEGGPEQVFGTAKTGRYHVTVISDIHAGSSHYASHKLDKFLKFSSTEYTVSCGDNVDGNKEVLIRDQKYHGFDDQIEDFSRILRKHKTTYIGITGNHDGYFSESSGFDAGRVLSSRLKEDGVDWRHLGTCLGHAKIYGARWELWHPMGGTSSRNALRRLLNARVEGMLYACDILGVGHFHRHTTVKTFPENVYAFTCPTFQEKKSEFGNRITSPWDIGGLIVSYTIDAKGRCKEVSSEYVEV